MEIIVNGKQEHCPPCTIAEFVEKRGLQATAVIVELNRVIVKQERWQQISLKQDDELELLSFVGGG